MADAAGKLEETVDFSREVVVTHKPNRMVRNVRDSQVFARLGFYKGNCRFPHSCVLGFFLMCLIIFIGQFNKLYSGGLRVKVWKCNLESSIYVFGVHTEPQK